MRSIPPGMGLNSVYLQQRVQPLNMPIAPGVWGMQVPLALPQVTPSPLPLFVNPFSNPALYQIAAHDPSWQVLAAQNSPPYLPWQYYSSGMHMPVQTINCPPLYPPGFQMFTGLMGPAVGAPLSR